MRWARDFALTSLSALALASTPSACGDDGGAGTGTDGASESGDTETIDEGPWDSLAERPCPEGSHLDANNFGIPFFLTHCNGCHSADIPEGERQGAPASVNFNTLDDIRAQADRVWARAGDQNVTMPPVDSVPDDERVQLGEWLACGAPLSSVE